MATQDSPPNSSQSASATDRLESWKEIAAYLRREVRTVQRWEKKEGLPVHRHLHDKLGTVYAFKSELDAWWIERRVRLEQEAESESQSSSVEPVADASPVPAPEAQEEPESPEETEKKSHKLMQPVKKLARPVDVPLGIFLALILVVGYFLIKHFWPKPTVPEGRVMIAVLPFDNQSNLPDEDYLGDGLAGEMTSLLGAMNLEKLGVIARQSSAVYKDSKLSAREIGAALGADYILDGSVRRENEQVRIIAELIHAKTNTQLWSRNYADQVQNVLDLQSRVAQQVVAEIRLQLSPEQQARLAASRPVNPEAYQAYLRGRYFFNRRDLEGLQQGLKSFQLAAQLEPNSVLAQTGLADTYNLLGFYGVLRPTVAYPAAKQAALHALHADPNLAEAHAALADVQLHFDYDWKAAEQSFRRAIELNPNYSVARHWFAVLLSLSGRHREALEEIQQALLHDPKSTVIMTDVALCYYNAREFEQAVLQIKEALKLDADFHLAHMWLGRAYLQLKRNSDAISEFQKTLQVQPGNILTLSFLGHALAVSGKAGEARAILLKLEDLSRQRYIPPTLMALVTLGLGDYNATFQWAERAFREHDPLLTRLQMDPIVDPIRKDPRFAELVRRVGPPAAHP
ncbi:MAG TPA: tetratricopeptide repeat protein [Candidatus Nitrosotenuis sp.]|nr:tetratricopeptide repeat protein [Candidatus Nitrosotenuis sp.]